MHAALNVNLQSGYCAIPMERKKQKQKNSEETIEMFDGFWKYVGVVSTFLVGTILFLIGADIILRGFWVVARTSEGPLGNIMLAPLVIGCALVWLSIAEFLKTIREERNNE